jgi:hypothetical protein
MTAAATYCDVVVAGDGDVMIAIRPVGLAPGRSVRVSVGKGPRRTLRVEQDGRPHVVVDGFSALSAEAIGAAPKVVVVESGDDYLMLHDKVERD